MGFLPLLAVGFIMKVVAVLFIFCSVALILIILIQKGRGGGLSAAFGGGMASNILGSKTGDFLTWITIVLVGIFLTLAVLMAKFYRPSISDYDVGPPIPQTQPAETQLPPLPPSDEAQTPVLDSETPVGNIEEDTDANLPGG
jgi:preprotein translocase subunit SecG